MRTSRSALLLGAQLLISAATAGCGGAAGSAGGPSAGGHQDARAGARDAAGRSSGAPTAVAGNLLSNPGFEDGGHGWKWLQDSQNWGPFEVVAAPVRSGRAAALLRVAWPAQGPSKAVRVFGVVQEIPGPAFPEVVSGHYRVDGWSKDSAATSLYLQAVVIVWGDPRATAIVAGGGSAQAVNNYQIRYYLAGLEQPPFVLQNARYKFVGKGAPKQGEWVAFHLDVKADFREVWNASPEGHEFVRVLFEGRWDGKPDGTGVSANVTYDDLYAGPAPGP